ncbi:unnamed protein product [Caretta caretta]
MKKADHSLRRNSTSRDLQEEEVGRTDMEWMQELCQQLSGLRVTVLPQNIESWIRGDHEAEEFCPVAESLTDDQILQAVRPTTFQKLKNWPSPWKKKRKMKWTSFEHQLRPVAGLETQDIEPIKNMQLRSLLQFAKRKQHSSKKQKQLTDFKKN